MRTSQKIPVAIVSVIFCNGARHQFELYMLALLNLIECNSPAKITKLIYQTSTAFFAK